MDDIYDLVVIGAGPAGEVAAELAASFGRRVLVVERSKPGGVVTTTGGAPTKALREAAVYLTGYRQEEVYGVRAAVPLEEVVPILRARVERVRDVLQEAVAQRLAARGIAYLQGTARLGADRTVRVTSPGGEEEHRLEARAILLATGSRPTHPVGVPFDDPDVYDSNPFREIVADGLETRAVSARYDEFGKAAKASSASGSSVCRQGGRAADGCQGHKRRRRHSGGSAPHRSLRLKKRSTHSSSGSCSSQMRRTSCTSACPAGLRCPMQTRWFQEREREGGFSGRRAAAYSAPRPP